MPVDDIGLKRLLDSTGIPVKYRNIAPDLEMTPPFIGFHLLETENFVADDKVYSQAERYSINLCTVQRDKARENLIEQALNDACIFWDKYENYIAEEQMFQITYEVTI